MTRIRKVLVVGGGIGGMSTAITLRQQGVQVDLIDIDPHWRVYGAGITITGATLRAFKGIGILDEVIESAYTGDGIQVCNLQGRKIGLVPTVPVEPGVPGCGGIMRPLLHKLLSSKTIELGTDVRLGVTVNTIVDRDDAVHVEFSDGREDRYDVVVGADGVYSKVRTLLFPNAPRPRYSGQSVWRIRAPRAPEIERRYFFLGGPSKVGLTPVSASEMYMFLLETTPRHDLLPDEALPGMLSGLLESYGGPLKSVRESLGPDTKVVLRPLEGFLLPAPWYLGRTILIGDAAHPTTPQLASGAGMAIEDALVLGQELSAAASVADAFGAFTARRYERCRLVVENSMEIGRREQQRAPIEQQTDLVAQSLQALAEPI